MLYQIQSFNKVVGKFEAIGDAAITPSEAIEPVAQALGELIWPVNDVHIGTDGQLERVIIPVFSKDDESIARVHEVMKSIVNTDGLDQ
jgi:hypothetical protein